MVCLCTTILNVQQKVMKTNRHLSTFVNSQILWCLQWYTLLYWCIIPLFLGLYTMSVTSIVSRIIETITLSKICVVLLSECCKVICFHIDETFTQCESIVFLLQKYTLGLNYLLDLNEYQVKSLCLIFRLCTMSC